MTDSNAYVRRGDEVLAARRPRHPLAGQTVTVHPASKPVQLLRDGARYWVEDWWQNVSGESWVSSGAPACLVYGARAAGVLPVDDEVVCGIIEGRSYLVHVSELEAGS